MNKNKEDLCHLVKHPMLQSFLTQLRKKETPPHEFRRIVRQMSYLMLYEATYDLQMKMTKVSTPFEDTEGQTFSEKFILVSILRAGNEMLSGALEALPNASVGHIGIYRDKFLKTTVEYYFRLPSEMEQKKVFLFDPLLATADTAIAAINRLKDYDVGPIKFISLLASPEGLEKIKSVHPDVQIYTTSIERGLNQDGFLLPGVGDAGDRLYGTF